MIKLSIIALHKKLYKLDESKKAYYNRKITLKNKLLKLSRKTKGEKMMKKENLPISMVLLNLDQRYGKALSSMFYKSLTELLKEYKCSLYLSEEDFRTEATKSFVNESEGKSEDEINFDLLFKGNLKAYRKIIAECTGDERVIDESEILYSLQS